MKISQIRQLLNARVICGQDRLEEEIFSAFGCDLMSDVLAFANNEGMLLSGLMNPQVVRTAEMMDMDCIVFVRGKKLDDTAVKLAEQKGMIVLQTTLTMYTACGILYNAGLRTGEENFNTEE